MLRLALRAMACRFELVLDGEDAAWLRAAGEEAFAEIRRLEALLSFYRAGSALSRVNARAADAPVRVPRPLFRLLRTAQRLHERTAGAFDPTVGRLMRCWGFVRGTGHLPEADALAEARRCTGLHLVELDDAAGTVRFARPGVQLDLGGIGKGFAIDEAMALLAELGVEAALLHAGTSTVAARGRPASGEAWRVALPHPAADARHAAAADLIALVDLDDEALSASAVWGKAFEAEGRRYGHVLDPRLGHPVEGALLAAVVTPTATEADALSTALLVEGRSAPALLAAERRRGLVALPEGDVLTEGLMPLLHPSDVS